MSDGKLIVLENRRDAQDAAESDDMKAKLLGVVADAEKAGRIRAFAVIVLHEDDHGDLFIGSSYTAQRGAMTLLGGVELMAHRIKEMCQ